MKWRLKNRALTAEKISAGAQVATGGDVTESSGHSYGEPHRDTSQEEDLPVHQGISRFLESCVDEQSYRCIESPSWTVAPHLSIRDVLGAQPAPPPVLMLNDVDHAMRQRVMQAVQDHLVPTEQLDFRRASTDGASGDEHEMTQHMVGLIHEP
mmetsp:Transcript_97065/g.169421  ORF Transcript_97065/g.169421 Transcript_97065/m.169421 type:complete len:153 (+) Transcript_97065:112-570(+)